jgi:hypothetical protein
MADLSDVEQALALLATQALYPSGISLPPAVSALCKLHRGWPLPRELDADMKAGNIVVVSVFAQRNASRNTSRYPREWQQAQTQPAATMTATVSGAHVTIAGTVSAAQIVALIINGATAYAYRPLATDAAADVATALAALVPSATVSGAVVTVPGSAPRITARVEADAITTRELRRQEQSFTITIWAPTPALRDAAASVVDTLFAGLDRFALADGYSARVRYVSTGEDDSPQRGLLFRRDLRFTVEYPTTETATTPRMAVGVYNITSNLAGSAATILV